MPLAHRLRRLNARLPPFARPPPGGARPFICRSLHLITRSAECREGVIRGAHIDHINWNKRNNELGGFADKGSLGAVLAIIRSIIFLGGLVCSVGFLMGVASSTIPISRSIPHRFALHSALDELACIIAGFLLAKLRQPISAPRIRDLFRRERRSRKLYSFTTPALRTLNCLRCQ